ncbi:MAG: hypothetical protein FWC67_00365, partial [Defluviitaleaceae bacterium]|nr:hypothetical protein [Defluviitaleaceae bacterium]
SSWQTWNRGNNRGTTGIDGNFVVQTTARNLAQGVSQGQVQMTFNVEATLPEVGPTRQHASVRVFINPIEMRARATRDGADATLSVNINNITLDRLNDGTAEHSGDFLCSPVAGHNVSAVLSRVYWVAVRTGEFYCFIERRVVPRYRHERRTQTIDRFEVTTDENGEILHDFTVPNRERESYELRLTTYDTNGRPITRTLFVGRDFTDFHSNAGDGRLFLYGARPWWDEGYDFGEEVSLAIMRGTEAVTHGNTLFVMVQDGILYHQVGSNSFNFIFEEKHAPNVTVYAFYFNGHTFHHDWGMRQSIRFNHASRELLIDVVTNQDEYRPGDMATLTITTTDGAGNPKAANVNIALVDEALFALRDHNVNTLQNLYSNVSASLRLNRATHRSFDSDGIQSAADFAGSAVMISDEAPMAARESADMADMAGGGDTHLRETFEDTAFFASIRTNDAGVAELSFRLPDNITSWRLTSSGISNDLYAGNSVTNVIVTQPMFLHYALASVFLVGDAPTLGVNVYGTSLGGGENVIVEVWDEAAPGQVFTTRGAAFERIEIPLWPMAQEGSHAIIIRAMVEGGGLSDMVRHAYRVVSSHRLIDTAVFYEVTGDTVFAAGRAGLTNITFTDLGRGRFLNDLFGMLNPRGNRIEGLVAQSAAHELINEHFPDISLFNSPNNFDAREFQQNDGGMAMLPHASSDLALTIGLMPFILDDISTSNLRNYLNNIFAHSTAENRMLALYGLAMLREPVLIDLQNYALLQDLSVQNLAYIALAFAALGELDTARNIYTERILPYVNAQAMSTVALLAAKLGKPEAIELHENAMRPRSRTDLLTMLERLQFISLEINNHNATPASISYTMFGQEYTRDLSWGGSFTLRIPAQNLHEFEITSITGEVGALSLHQTPLEDIDIIDSNIGITRNFIFRPNGLVRVEITVDYSAKNIEGSYVITDYLPAGLAFVPWSARFRTPQGTSGWRHAAVDGRRIMFFDHNNRFNNTRTYYYYARIITPGIFTAEGVTVQSLDARNYITIGETRTITIP